MFVIRHKIIHSLIIVLVFFWGGGCVRDAADHGNIVAVNGDKGSWTLAVNGNPVDLKGVGVSRITDRNDPEVDFLKLAKDMGANTVRTWGADQGTPAYLDRAKEYGLYVNAGIWLNPVMEQVDTPVADRVDYVQGSLYTARAREDALEYVRRFKDHPAVLFWNVGNEVIFWTQDESQKVAFCRYLEKLICDIKAIDPKHLVVYSSAYTAAVPYIREYVPSLDILGVNVYGGLSALHREVVDNLDIPYLITELGPTGNWDRPRDTNDRAREASDEAKAMDYKQRAHEAARYKGYCLGFYAFVLGDTTQITETWWNITQGSWKKLSYLAMREFFTGQKPEAHPPTIKNLVLSKSKNLRPMEEFEVTVELRSADKGAFRYEYFVSTANEIIYLKEYPNQRIPVRISGSGPTAKIQAPDKPGVYRVYAVVVDENDLASTVNKTVAVPEAVGRE